MIQVSRLKSEIKPLLKKRSKTGKKFIYGNERLITEKKLHKIFQIHNIKSEYYNIRLLPTFLTKYQILISIAKKLEIRSFEKYFEILYTYYFCRHKIN